MVGNESVFSAADDTLMFADKVKKRVITKEDLKADNKKCNILLCVVSILAIILTLVGLYLVFGRTFVARGINLLRKVTRDQTPLNLAILFLVQFFFGFILFLPGLATYNILQAFLMKSFWVSFLISAGGCYAASLTVYLVVRSCCHQKIYKKLKHMVVYRMLLTESKKTPIKTGMLFNFLFIPVSVKNYLFAISGLKFHHCLIALPPGHCLMTAICSMIGAKVNDISEVFTTKDYANKSKVEKLQSIVSMALLVFTIAFFFTLFCVIKRKYKEYQEKQLGIIDAVEAETQREEEDRKGSIQSTNILKGLEPNLQATQGFCPDQGLPTAGHNTNPFASDFQEPGQPHVV